MATRPTRRTVFGSLAVAAVLATAMGQQAASASPTGDSQEKSIQKAMQRDLGLNADQAKTRVAQETKAAKTQKSLERSLGSDYAGSWFDAKAGKLVVGVTTDKAAATVRDGGGQPLTLTRSADQLDATKAKLDQAKAKASSKVAQWYVDVRANKVVVQGTDLAAAKAFVKKAGVSGSSVQVAKTAERSRTFAQGGDAYYINGSARCSIGFAVSGGFVTAGHCGTTGSSVSGSVSGSFAGSSFPGNDYAFVRTSTAVSGTVKNGSSSVAVKGSSEAAIGSSICRSGSTTGWHCGTIQARNSTVNYAEGSVSGLIRTSVCAEPGDSGGSAISGNQAQGVTSGGSGNCSSGGTTYFQPVNEILSVYGLTLTTS